MRRSSRIAAVAVASLLLAVSAGLIHAAETKSDLAETHKAGGGQCASCHGQDVKEIIPSKNCFVCHDSYEKLGEQTKDMHLNPHKSPHFLDLDCTSCHQGHKAFVNFCQDCHGPITRHN